MQAYDLAMVTRPADRSDPNCHGWCFGLPPGLTPAQWPLDPANGYPMQHGFTLLLPEDYRCHGPDVVALSFFASAIDHNDGGPIENDPAIRAAMEGESGEPLEDPALLPFWRAERGAHPRLHRMEDILGAAFAAILLTREEFDGPLCHPPAPAIDASLDPLPPPLWMERGGGAALWGDMDALSSGSAAEDGLCRMLGGIPEPDLAWNRALTWSPRREDPNAGIPPRETRFGDEQDAGGYQMRAYWLDGIIEQANYRVHDWAQEHARDHIGGTMRPVQNMPEFSPFYVEFEEYLGGYNFGGGNAQLDFRDMKLDWACG